MKKDQELINILDTITYLSNKLYHQTHLANYQKIAKRTQFMADCIDCNMSRITMLFLMHHEGLLTKDELNELLPNA